MKELVLNPLPLASTNRDLLLISSTAFRTDVKFRKQFHLLSQPVRYDEMKDTEKLWLRHQVEFLPQFHLSISGLVFLFVFVIFWVDER